VALLTVLEGVEESLKFVFASCMAAGLDSAADKRR